MTKPTKREAEKRVVIAGVRRVLRLVDGYLSHMDQDLLMAHDGGLMTVGELRRHVRYAGKACAKLRGKK